MIEPGLLEGFDSQPYRTRLRDVMTARPVALPETAVLAEAARQMADRSISSVLVHRGDAASPTGIVTEHDLTTQIALHGPGALDRPLDSVMHGPVRTVGTNELVYVAIGRMARLGVRHLVVVDGEGRAVGIVTARGLLDARAGPALPLGDQAMAAESAEDLAQVRRALPELARQLLSDGVHAREVTAVLAAVLRDTTARAAALAARDLEAEGFASTRARWCLLVLGSGGRGESMLAPDQDNAIVHDAPDGDPWLAALGERLADILHAAGVPYCHGGVMAKNAAWRQSLAGWRREISSWIRRKEGAELLNVDIFYDFRPVKGDRRLASELRSEAMHAAARAPLFLRLLASQVDEMPPPLGPFGGVFGMFRLEDGRVDLKKGGVMPIVCGVRALCLRHEIAATGTAERLAGLVERGALNREDADSLAEAQETLMRSILEQQIADSAVGASPGNRVDPMRLTRTGRRRLRDSLRAVENIPDLVAVGLKAG